MFWVWLMALITIFLLGWFAYKLFSGGTPKLVVSGGDHGHGHSDDGSAGGHGDAHASGDASNSSSDSDNNGISTAHSADNSAGTLASGNAADESRKCSN